MITFEIDLSEVSSRSQFHDRIKESLPCPDYYGCNLDALHDVHGVWPCAC